ncbi:TRAP transporter small permease subunit [Kushneria aurantia]|uniref:TRAP transporter small permease protein n=1 Tax=Kushneria aurantia TaxID=504092 RepID=A0ABV6G0N1_9GAMM|nr:TRAP transporter small permease subunit [Kushneria aurantia]
MHAFINQLCRWVLNLCGLFLLLIAFVIGAGVLMHLLGLSQLVKFDNPYWLLGRGITFNSLMGLQILLFTLAMMLAIAPVMWLDRHVRVDVFHVRFSPRVRTAIELVGHLALGLPFFVLLSQPAYRFAERAYVTGERSTDGGLNDLYVIKAALPVGVALFVVVLVLLVAIHLWRLVVGRSRHA